MKTIAPSQRLEAQPGGLPAASGYAPMPETNTRQAKDLPLWLYKGALWHVQSIPLEDRKTLLAHKLKSSEPHPLELA